MSKHKNKYDLVIFDLDGTLVNSMGDIAKSYCQACEQFGYPLPTIEEVTLWIGQGHAVAVANCYKWLNRELLTNGTQVFPCLADNPLASELSPQEIFDQIIFPQLPEFQRIHKDLYINVGHDNSYLFPGVVHSLMRLRWSGVKTAVLTNKMKELTPGCLKALRILDLFDKTFSDGELENNKPHPEGILKMMDYFGLTDKSRVLMVGDSSNDIKAGKDAGVEVLGLSYGYNYGSSVADHNPTYVSDHFCACVALNEKIRFDSEEFEKLITDME